MQCSTYFFVSRHPWFLKRTFVTPSSTGIDNFGAFLEYSRIRATPKKSLRDTLFAEYCYNVLLFSSLEQNRHMRASMFFSGQTSLKTFEIFKKTFSKIVNNFWAITKIIKKFNLLTQKRLEVASTKNLWNPWFPFSKLLQFKAIKHKIIHTELFTAKAFSVLFTESMWKSRKKTKMKNFKFAETASEKCRKNYMTCLKTHNSWIS